MVGTLACLGCGQPFSPERPPHVVDTLPDQGMIPYCDECHATLSLGEKKSLATLLVNGWRAGPLQKDYDAIEDAAHIFIELEHLLVKKPG